MCVNWCKAATDLSIMQLDQENSGNEWPLSDVERKNEKHTWINISATQVADTYFSTQFSFYKQARYNFCILFASNLVANWIKLDFYIGKMPGVNLGATGSIKHSIEFVYMIIDFIFHNNIINYKTSNYGSRLPILFSCSLIYDCPNQNVETWVRFTFDRLRSLLNLPLCEVESS